MEKIIEKLSTQIEKSADIKSENYSSRELHNLSFANQAVIMSALRELLKEKKS